MNRLDRVTTILIQLQARRVVRAQDIADRFGISLRTVYRDIRTLEEAGVPVRGEAGVGYALMDGYRLPPVMFTRDEAIAFVTAGKLVEQHTDSGLSAHYTAALYKVRAVLRTAEKDALEELDNRIEIARHSSPPAAENRWLGPIVKAIAEKETLRIAYSAGHNGALTDREVEPVGLLHTGSGWHLIAWCRMRTAYRDFRTDRITSLRAGAAFSIEHPALNEYLQSIAKKEALQTVRVLLKKEVVKHIQTARYTYGFVREQPVGDKVEMTFLVHGLEHISRWLLMLTDNAEITEPVRLHDMVSAHVAALQQHYT